MLREAVWELLFRAEARWKDKGLKMCCLGPWKNVAVNELINTGAVSAQTAERCTEPASL